MITTKPFLHHTRNEETVVLMVEYYVYAKGYARTRHYPGADDELEIHKIHIHPNFLTYHLLANYIKQIPHDLEYEEWDDYTSDDHESIMDHIVTTRRPYGLLQAT